MHHIFASLIHHKLNYKLVSVQSWSTNNYILSLFLSEPRRSGVSYGVMEYKVEYLIKEDYSKNAILQAIKRYLKGQNCKIAMKVGHPSFGKISRKNEKHGDVKRGESLITKI